MPLTAADKLEIQELFARYCQAVDNGDGEGFASVFTEDGVLSGIREPMQGRDVIAKFGGGAVARAGVPMRHWSGNAIIDGDGNSATARSYYMVSRSGDDAPRPSTGVYLDQLQRVNGQWLIKRRDAERDS